MTQTLTLEAHKTTLHVLAINLPPEDLASALEDPAALILRLLGTQPDKPDQAEIIAVGDLDGIGLTGFLREGPGIAEDILAPHKARLDAIEGYILLLHPNAYAETVSLALGPELTLIAALSSAPTDWSNARTLESKAANEISPIKAKKKPSDAAMSGRIAMVALLVIALLTWVMIWIA